VAVERPRCVTGAATRERLPRNPPVSPEWTTPLLTWPPRSTHHPPRATFPPMPSLASLLSRAPLLLALPVSAALAACGGRSGPLDAAPPDSGSISPSAPAPRHIYVADSRFERTPPGRLVEFDDFTGAGWTTWTGGTTTPLGSSCGVALDAQGRIYVGNSGALLRLDDISGAGLVSFGQPGQFVNVIGVAVDGSGRIYILDELQNLLVRMDDMSGSGFTSLGTPSGGAGKGEFDHPSGVAISPSGKILVADLNNGRLVEMDDISGAGWTTWDMPTVQGQGPATPYGVAYDPARRIYAVDFDSSTLYRMDNIRGDGLVAFSHPPLVQMSHVFVHASGRIYLAMLNATSTVAVMDDMTGAGLQVLGTNGDGRGQFGNPCGIVAR
jgi:hypothetical protein